ncbi:MAG TPA: outer membrane beta-barrel domain-containing protein [Steroidobacteraceae bacterium]|nr:outer membrane beta-barrel domain-containing protein [Steroidobacteraceae bacterium]
MENRIRVLFLSAALVMAGCSSLPWRDEDPVAAPEPAAGESEETPVVIEPQVERREIKPAKIDTENWEAGATVGSLSVEDFEVNIVYGARIAYHINEDFFAEGIVGQSDAGLSSFERLSGGAPLLTDSERRFTYYSLGFGWNALPGEIFLGGRRALNSTVYLTLGAGSTRFAGGDRFTLTAGAGLRVLVKDWLAVHLDMRDHVQEIDVLGSNKTSHNYEATLSLTAFF